MRIIDCFTFFDGLDVLEIRLNVLSQHVNEFVICESKYNMIGKEKRLIFGENQNRFKDFPIIYIAVGDDHLDHMGGWEPYYYQINRMTEALDNLRDNDIVMLSDFDEIPDLRGYRGAEGIFHQKLYYYYLNVFTGRNNWKGTVTLTKSNVAQVTLGGVRMFSPRLPKIGEGWHFSYAGATEQDIINKIESSCHQEFNTKKIKNRIAECKKNLMSPFTEEKFVVEEPTGPKWLLENRGRYEHLFYKGVD